MLFGAIHKSFEFTSDEKRILKSFAGTLAERIAGGRAFTCLITNDQEMRQWNRNFLGHDYATDVLSFPASPLNGNLGDIAISADRARAQAEELRHSTVDEVRILMLHGLLHLAGMDHESDRGEMAGAERKWRREFGLPMTLIARTAR